MPNDKEIEVEDISILLQELFDLQKSGNYFFRGISDETHFAPSLFREYQKVRGEGEDNTQVWEYETRLLERFGRYSVQYLPASLTHLDWVASAQHFGIPTRLLDWTFDPFCGMYFSVFYNENPQEDYYHLLVINKEDHIYTKDPINLNILTSIINHTDTDFYHNQFVYDFKQFIAETRHRFLQQGKLYFCSVNHSNPRIIAQNGLVQIPLTVGYGAQKGWIKDDIVRGCDRIYKIHKTQRKEILTKLENMNINSIRLFPDLQSVCDYIRRTTN